MNIHIFMILPFFVITVAEYFHCIVSLSHASIPIMAVTDTCCFFFFFFKYMHTLYVIFCVPLANVRQHSLLLGIFFFTSCPVMFSYFLCAPCYFQLLDYFPLGCQDIPVNIGITQQKAILFIHNYGFFLFYFF